MADDDDVIGGGPVELAAAAEIDLQSIAAAPQLVEQLSNDEHAKLMHDLLLANAAFGLRAKRDPLAGRSGDDDDAPLLDYAAAARVLNRTERWVRRNAARCGGIQLGRTWRFSPKRLREFLYAER